MNDQWEEGRKEERRGLTVDRVEEEKQEVVI